jgi:hypothetical protein
MQVVSSQSFTINDELMLIHVGVIITLELPEQTNTKAVESQTESHGKSLLAKVGLDFQSKVLFVVAMIVLMRVVKEKIPESFVFRQQFSFYWFLRH